MKKEKIELGMIILFWISLVIICLWATFEYSRPKENPNQELINILDAYGDIIDAQISCQDHCDNLYDDCKLNATTTEERDSCFGLIVDCTNYCIEEIPIPEFPIKVRS